MSVRAISLLVALVMAVPIGAATWFGEGSYEPDTIYDQNGGLNWADPNYGSGEKVYFNVYDTEEATGMGANSGQLGSRIQTPGARQFDAIMGIWKDCNHDATIGLTEEALLVYPASTPGVDITICPVGGPHNDGVWINEYIPIGHNPGNTNGAKHPVQIDDVDAAVWGDFGLPGASTAGTCAITPLPHGTTASTGRAIRYADCFTSKRVTGTIDSNDPTGLLVFSDPNNPQNGPSLLQQNAPESLFGNPDTCQVGLVELDSSSECARGTDDYAFTTWDCSSGRATEVKNPTSIHSFQDLGLGPLPSQVDSDGNEHFDDNGDLAWTATAAPSAGDPTGSYADALNETTEGVHVGGGDANHDATYTGGDCGQAQDNSAGDNSFNGLYPFGILDGTSESGAQVAAKDSNDLNFAYFDGSPSLGDGTPLGPNTPNSIVSAPPLVWEFDPQYDGLPNFITIPQSINRATLQIVSSSYLSFYAKVGTTTTSAGYAVPGDGAYGAEACGTFVTGVHGGWSCDASTWKTGAITPGTHYQLRDIDCYDGTVARGSGVHASGSDVATDGGQPCQDASV